MADTIWNKISPVNPFTSVDGLILDVNTGDLGNTDTSYNYFLLGAAAFNKFSIQYVITATTLTFEGTNDDFSYANTADEQIVAANDRTFGGAGNWEADGTGASVVVAGGDLDVTVGSANTGAKLLSSYMADADANNVFQDKELRRGFQAGKRYTILLSISNTTGGTISVYAGTQLIASGLTDGAAQSFSFLMRKAGTKLSVIGNTAAMTFTIDNVSVKPVAAVWRDITDVVTDGAATSLTATGSVTTKNDIPWARIRSKRVTTNATNAIEERLTRMGI